MEQILKTSTTAVANITEEHARKLVEKISKISGDQLDYSSASELIHMVWDYQKLSMRKGK